MRERERERGCVFVRCTGVVKLYVEHFIFFFYCEKIGRLHIICTCSGQVGFFIKKQVMLFIILYGIIIVHENSEYKILQRDKITSLFLHFRYSMFNPI